MSVKCVHGELRFENYARARRNPASGIFFGGKMNCPRCYGRGRIVGEVTIHQGKKKKPISLTEIGVCPDCMGNGLLQCCEGERAEQLERAQAMINACNTDADPNGDEIPTAS